MKSSFRIETTKSEEESDWTAHGFDQVVYMISTNPGEPMRQLEHIASGGELSRVMLALKASVESGNSALVRSSNSPSSRKSREKSSSRRPWFSTRLTLASAAKRLRPWARN